MKAEILPDKLAGGIKWDYQLKQRLDDPKALERYGYRVYSQNDEDGIIEEIFNRIGTVTKRFVEFGVQNGLECNTHLLLLNGWNGLWIEGDQNYYDEIQSRFMPAIRTSKLKVINAFITKDNINSLISGNGISGEIDLLSIDIDGNDYHVWKVIDAVNPRVVIMEYNAKLPPTTEYIMEYDEGHCWDGTDYFGSSLKSLELLGHELGYQLVGCNITGSNAFFIRKDLAKDSFAEPATAEYLYNPCRYHIKHIAGHKAHKLLCDGWKIDHKNSLTNMADKVKRNKSDKLKKVFIWGTGDWCGKLMQLLPANCCIAGFVETVKSKEIYMRFPVYSVEEYLSHKTEADLTIIAVKDSQKIMDTLKTSNSLENVWFSRKLEYPDEVYFENFQKDQASIHVLFSGNTESIRIQRQLNRYAYTECMEGISFLCNCKYQPMMQVMEHAEVYQSHDCRHFLALAQQYYGIPEDTDGIFIDIGANIGTTSLYVKKCLNKNLKIIAFEPSPENCKQYRCNSVLNDISDDDITLVRAALSNYTGTAKLMMSLDNYGDNRIIVNGNGETGRIVETVKAFRLDDWIKNNDIPTEKIKYIWMDTQAHEGFCIEGALELLQNNKIPLYLEFWPVELRKNNSLDLLIYNLEKCYSGYIDMENNKEKHEIKDLYILADSLHNNFTDIFLIK